MTTSTTDVTGPAFVRLFRRNLDDPVIGPRLAAAEHSLDELIGHAVDLFEGRGAPPLDDEAQALLDDLLVGIERNGIDHPDEAQLLYLAYGLKTGQRPIWH